MPDTVTNPYTAHAAAGAAVLDDLHPGWAYRINVDRLAMSNGSDCVLGQLYGHYCTALNVAGPFVDIIREWGADDDVDWRPFVRAHGFNLNPDEVLNWFGTRTGTPPYDLLRAAWLPEIEARRGR